MKVFLYKIFVFVIGMRSVKIKFFVYFILCVYENCLPYVVRIFGTLSSFAFTSGIIFTIIYTMKLFDNVKFEPDFFIIFQLAD